jgi:hypothetical protein
MSEPLRIALVAEGPTDQPLIAAALNAILPGRPFVLTQLQPELTYPQMGTGWGGVLKWCYAAGARHTGPIDSDPTLELYDLLIIHLDLDVCGKQYADYPQLPDDERRANWGALPIHYCCPPASTGADKLASVLQTWLTPATIPPKGRTVLCLPAQSSGTWLAVATGSAVSVLVMDCTTMGALPPTVTVPTRTATQGRRDREDAAELMGISSQFSVGFRHLLRLRSA